jgi:glutamate 5-kinase
MISADCVVLLSDIDGLYTAPPALDPEARRLDVVSEITPEIEAMAGDAGSELSRGGMVTKLIAAKIAVGAGADLVITSGKVLHPLRALGEGAPCTWFLASGNPTLSRKRWIAGSLKPRGIVTIDDGARAALERGRSLLPAGVIRVEGNFDRGDAVIIHDAAGRELGRGLVAYARADAEQLLGRKSAEIEGILGYRGRSELIHRDDMALTRSG